MLESVDRPRSMPSVCGRLMPSAFWMGTATFGILEQEVVDLSIEPSGDAGRGAAVTAAAATAANLP